MNMASEVTSLRKYCHLKYLWTTLPLHLIELCLCSSIGVGLSPYLWMGFIFPNDQTYTPVFRTLLNGRVRWLTSLLSKSLNKVDGRPSGPGTLPLFVSWLLWLSLLHQLGNQLVEKFAGCVLFLPLRRWRARGPLHNFPKWSAISLIEIGMCSKSPVLLALVTVYLQKFWGSSHLKDWSFTLHFPLLFVYTVVSR